MKIVFFGTPQYVLPILDRLNKEFKVNGHSPICAVVTQEPKPIGRTQKLEYSAVDKWAFERKIPAYTDLQKFEEESDAADLGVLASYGNIIPKNIINNFKYGIIVVHPSLLPQFRWASPIPATLITGLKQTGVSFIKMSEKWDQGPTIAQFKSDVFESDTTGSLRDRLFFESAEVLIHTIPAYIKGKINLKKQDDEKATFARIITKEDAFIPPKQLAAVLQNPTLQDIWEIPFIKINGKPYTTNYSPTTIHNFIRAMDPWPGAWTLIKLQGNEVTKQLRLKLLKSHTQTDHVASYTKLVLDLVQLEGKNTVTWEEFKRGYPKFSF